MSVRSEILSQFTQVAQEQNRQLVSITDDLPLLNSGLDSLCLAVIIARLEDVLSVDPFSNSGEFDFPVTVGDLVGLYERACRDIAPVDQFVGGDARI